MINVSRDKFRKAAKASGVRLIATDLPSAIVLKGSGTGDPVEIRVTSVEWGRASDTGQAVLSQADETLDLKVGSIVTRNLARFEQDTRFENIDESNFDENIEREDEPRRLNKPVRSRAVRTLKSFGARRLAVAATVDTNPYHFSEYRLRETLNALEFIYRIAVDKVDAYKGVTGSSLNRHAPDVGFKSSGEAERLLWTLYKQGHCQRVGMRYFKPNDAD